MQLHIRSSGSNHKQEGTFRTSINMSATVCVVVRLVCSIIRSRRPSCSFCQTFKQADCSLERTQSLRTSLKTRILKGATLDKFVLHSPRWPQIFYESTTILAVCLGNENTNLRIAISSSPTSQTVAATGEAMLDIVAANQMPCPANERYFLGIIQEYKFIVLPPQRPRDF